MAAKKRKKSGAKPKNRPLTHADTVMENTSGAGHAASQIEDLLDDSFINVPKFPSIPDDLPGGTGEERMDGETLKAREEVLLDVLARAEEATADVRKQIDTAKARAEQATRLAHVARERAEHAVREAEEYEAIAQEYLMFTETLQRTASLYDDHSDDIRQEVKAIHITLENKMEIEVLLFRLAVSVCEYAESVGITFEQAITESGKLPGNPDLTEIGPELLKMKKMAEQCLQDYRSGKLKGEEDADASPRQPATVEA